MLLNNPQASSPTDLRFEIVSGDKTFRVHRLVISMHSSYFDRLVSSSFRESAEKRVTLHEDSTLAVSAMVDYFYTFNYEVIIDGEAPAEDSASAPRNTLEAHSHVFSLGEKYDVPGLKKLACAKFRQGLNEQVFRDRLQAATDLLTATMHIYQRHPAWRALAATGGLAGVDSRLPPA